MSRRYLLISPCRDEAQYLRYTLDSVAAQSVLPALWVIVDDGSTDATSQILAEYAARYPWIHVVRRDDRGVRSVGPGVVEAFYAGLDYAKRALPHARALPDRSSEYTYVCKLDCDVDLPPQYFELLMWNMEDDPRLGTVSGKPWFLHDWRLQPEICGDEMSAGMTKFYRRECFDEIGGFVRAVMWDGIDCHRCRMLGWRAASLPSPMLRFVHLRPQGASDRGVWQGRLRAGAGQYYMGTAPLYYAVAAVHRLLEYPAVLGSIGLLWGYLRSWLRSEPRYADPRFRRFLRSYQYRCLRLGKRAATARLDAEQAALWRDRHAPARQAVGSGV